MIILSALILLLQVVWISSMAMSIVDSVPACSTFQTICVMNPDQSLMATDKNDDDRFITVPIDGAYYLSFQVTHRYITPAASLFRVSDAFDLSIYLPHDNIHTLDARRHVQGLHRLVFAVWIDEHIRV